MPTQIYRLKDGTRVSGVTTILSRFKESGGLIHWAWQQGVDGKDYRETRDSAADSGTCAHAMIECDWKGVPFDRSKYEPDVLDKADHAFLGYLEWKDQINLKVVKSEIPLVSEKHKFGGCPDAVIAKNRLFMGDYKTSNRIYSDYLLQVGGGYTLLYEENFPGEKIEGIVIARFSKPDQPDDPISFHNHFYSAEIIPILQKQFLLLRDAYEGDKRIKKLV